MCAGRSVLIPGKHVFMSVFQCAFVRKIININQERGKVKRAALRETLLQQFRIRAWPLFGRTNFIVGGVFYVWVCTALFVVHECRRLVRSGRATGRVDTRRETWLRPSHGMVLGDAEWWNDGVVPEIKLGNTAALAFCFNIFCVCYKWEYSFFMGDDTFFLNNAMIRFCHFAKRRPHKRFKYCNWKSKIRTPWDALPAQRKLYLTVHSNFRPLRSGLQCTNMNVSHQMQYQAISTNFMKMSRVS